jgi:hypothetical protein
LRWLNLLRPAVFDPLLTQWGRYLADLALEVPTT